MVTRRGPFRPDATVWIVRTTRDGLSDDLRHGAPVLFLFAEGYWAFIRDGRGTQRRVPLSSLDPGSEYQGRSGRWYSEDHPVVQRALARMLAHLESEDAVPEEIARIRSIINRYPDFEAEGD